ncbi:MAG: hypothetical protein N3G21_01980 [Candidatus Hydrogenedentes bacterium]|nr:hypothetical protein [Candidatus Hydrogenedentota bacterium]
MRFDYPKRFFQSAGKSLFTKRNSLSNIDDSVSEEEKKDLLGQKELLESNSEGFLDSLIELAKKISLELSRLKLILEEAKKNPNSKDWVETALGMLGNAVNIAHKYSHHELEKIIINMARILISADRVGKAGLIVEELYILHAELCILIAECILGKGKKETFEKISSTYANISSKIEKMGIKLISDDEELREQINEDFSPNTEESPLTQNTYSASPVEKNNTQDFPLPEIVESSSVITYSEIKPKIGEDAIVHNLTQNSSELVSQKEDTVEPTAQLTQTSSTVIGNINEITPITEDESPKVQPQSNQFSENSASNLQTEDISNISSEIYPAPPKVESSQLDYMHSTTTILETIKNENIKEKLKATLKALAENSPELAKQKAVELAIEIANLEIAELKNKQKTTEIQIETIKCEIEQVDMCMHECKCEEEQVRNELYTQEKQREEILRDKQNSEFELSKIREELQNIENQIKALFKKKEETERKMQEVQDSICNIEKSIDDNQKIILSIKESLSELGEKLRSLNEKKLLLLSALEEKQNILKVLSDHLNKKENTLNKLVNSLDLISVYANQSLDHSSPTNPIPDLFNGVSQ